MLMMFWFFLASSSHSPCALEPPQAFPASCLPAVPPCRGNSIDWLPDASDPPFRACISGNGLLLARAPPSGVEEQCRAAAEEGHTGWKAPVGERRKSGSRDLDLRMSAHLTGERTQSWGPAVELSLWGRVEVYGRGENKHFLLKWL